MSDCKYSQEDEIGREGTTNTFAASHAYHCHKQHSQGHPHEPPISVSKVLCALVINEQSNSSKGDQKLTLEIVEEPIEIKIYLARTLDSLSYHQDEVDLAYETSSNALVVKSEVLGLTLGIIVGTIARGWRWLNESRLRCIATGRLTIGILSIWSLWVGLAATLAVRWITTLWGSLRIASSIATLWRVASLWRIATTLRWVATSIVVLLIGI